jgi:hypothetical protein
VRRIIGAALSAVLVVGMVAVGAWQLLTRNSGSLVGSAAPIGADASIPSNLTTVRDVVGSEKKAFLADP